MKLNLLLAALLFTAPISAGAASGMETSKLFGDRDARPQQYPADTSRIIDIEEAVVVASPKQTSKLRQSPTSVSLFGEHQLESLNIHSMSDLSGFAPNFYMPSYGSTQSSAIYVRGVGSRSGTPAVSLYVDNVPTVNRAGYNFNLLGVNRIDILRGSQGTLYGRGAMGGLVRIYTENPLRSQGTTLRSGASSRDGNGYISALTSQKLNSNLGLSLGAFWQSSKGVWRNGTMGSKTGGKEQAGGRFRLVYNPSERWHLDFTSMYEYTDEKAYPYFYNGVVSGDETLPHDVGKISANRKSKYRRNLLSTGLTAEYRAPLFTLSSVTSYQNLDDRMLMDQDFVSLDYYTLEQRQKSHALTEEIVLKSLPGRRWEWSGGLFGLWEALRTQSPVTFYGDGIAMLNGNIGSALPDITYTNPYTGLPLNMPLSLAITDPTFAIPGRFNTPVMGGAAFFQGTLHDFIAKGLDLTLGLRLDYEHLSLRYLGGGTAVNYSFSMPMMEPADLVSTPTLRGKFSNDYTRLLPKAALQYNFPDKKGNVYLSFSEGQRSGGYNIQMFSEVVSREMRSDMMSGTKGYCDGLLQNLADRAASPALKQMFLGIKQTMDNNFPEIPESNVEDVVTYKPEYCLNYEAGTHLNLFGNALTADLSVFYMDTHHQQIARFAETGLGRRMVNAGRSHSCGIEASLRSNLLDNHLSLMLNYGYTHAVFHTYNAGDGQDFTDNYVPFIPEHNLGAMADYTFNLERLWLKHLTLGANVSAMGRIYWTEANNAYQNFYATLGAHALLDFGLIQFNLWGKNLTQNHYRTFYFETLNRGYYQKGMPLQIGFDMCFRI